MGLVSKAIPGLYNGVSQQSPILRSDTQCELQENALSSMSKGIQKRPPTEILFNLTAAFDKASDITLTILEYDEPYALITTKSSTVPIEIYQIRTGLKCDVDIPTPDTYFETITQPLLATIKDSTTTIISNPNVTVETNDAVSGTTNLIAQTREGLETARQAAATGGADTTNWIGEVCGEITTNYDSYYLKHIGGGNWVETAKPGIVNSFKTETLPHKLTKTGNLIFQLEPMSWTIRKAGDEYSAPVPSFVGKKILNTFFFQGRMGMLTDSTVAFSKVFADADFWPDTALDVLDSDPIDIMPAASETIPKLAYMVPFNKALVIVGLKCQYFVSSGDNVFSPKTVSITPATKYEVSPLCAPIRIGDNVYFASPQGSYTGIREFFVRPNSLTVDAPTITTHVPQYIPKNVVKLVSMAEYDTMFVQSKDTPTILYTYKYTWGDEGKYQASWSKWIFSETIKAIAAYDNKLYMIMKNAATDSLLSIQYMSLEDKTTDVLPFRVHLDKQILRNGSYNAATNITTWELPYKDSGTDFSVIKLFTGLSVPSVINLDGTHLVAPGDHSDSSVVLGKNYTMKYRFSPWYIKNENGTSLLQGRLQIRKIGLYFSETGAFKVVVTPKYRDSFTHEFSAIKPGVTLFNEPALLTGDASFLVLANAEETYIDIVSEGYLPATFQQAEFVGWFIQKTRPVL